MALRTFHGPRRTHYVTAPRRRPIIHHFPAAPSRAMRGPSQPRTIPHPPASMRSRSRLRHRHMLQTDGPVFVSGDGSILLSAMARGTSCRGPSRVRRSRSHPRGGHLVSSVCGLLAAQQSPIRGNSRIVFIIIPHNHAVSSSQQAKYMPNMSQ